MADKLTPKQKAQLGVLEALPARFEQMHRLIEEIAGMRADESVTRRLCRLLDESKAATNIVGLTALTETMGIMGMLARRTGGQQMKIRGLREGLGSLKINFEGALRSASTEESGESGEPPPS
ncbi:MAG TPA: hypothetical protein VF187_04360 [Gemmatimonadales bacterium]